MYDIKDIIKGFLVILYGFAVFPLYMVIAYIQIEFGFKYDKFTKPIFILYFIGLYINLIFFQEYVRYPMHLITKNPKYLDGSRRRHPMVNVAYFCMMLFFVYHLIKTLIG